MIDCRQKELEDRTVQKALKILERRLKVTIGAINCSEDAKNYLILQLSNKDHEVFSVLFLDTQLKLIEYKPLFFGTIDQSAIYPREVLKTCLQIGASNVILAHNHPSGSLEPSKADKEITARLKQALSMIDVGLVDHIIVAGNKTFSFTENGIL